MGDRFQEIAIGDESEFTHTVSPADVDAFARLTGDDNPLHVDPAFAARTLFKRPVAHGMLTASFISTLVGTRFPGTGSLLFEQHLRYLLPVRVGETICVRARAIGKSEVQRIIVLETVITGEDGRRVIEGETKVKVLKPEEKQAMSSQDRKGAVVVTGAGRGIGAAVAAKLALAGHPVVVNFLKDEASARAVVQDIQDTGGQALACRADVTDEAAVAAMVALARETFGPLAGVVSNASATATAQAFEELAWADMQRHLDVQIKGAFTLVRAALPDLLAAGGGTVVAIASVYAEGVPPVRILPYVTAKSALLGMMRALAAEYGPRGIRANCVSPGMTVTDFIADVPDKAKMVAKMQAPLRRLCLPDDVAGVVAFLFDERAAMLTGQNLRVCGGAAML